jgi:hypothetical protein
MGVELSQSRFEFAELWKKDDGYRSVENINSNFSDANMGVSLWDWFAVIDNTFTYLYPEDPDYPRQLLLKAHESLKDEGRVLLDFFNYAKRSAEGQYRQWSEFSAEDPYSYGLYKNKIDGGLNRCESIFIKRDGSESRKVEICKVYSLNEISILLDSCGFIVEEIFSTFNEQPFLEDASERLLIVAKKRV